MILNCHGEPMHALIASSVGENALFGRHGGGRYRVFFRENTAQILAVWPSKLWYDPGAVRGQTANGCLVDTNRFSNSIER
jgi:hypothetical protein